MCAPLTYIVEQTAVVDKPALKSRKAMRGVTCSHHFSTNTIKIDYFVERTSAVRPQLTTFRIDGNRIKRNLGSGPREKYSDARGQKFVALVCEKTGMYCMSVFFLCTRRCIDRDACDHDMERVCLASSFGIAILCRNS